MMAWPARLLALLTHVGACEVGGTGLPLIHSPYSLTRRKTARPMSAGIPKRPSGHVLVAAGGVAPRVLVVHVGLDTAGGDAVDGDARGAAADREGAGEAPDGRLGAGIQGVVGDV